MRFSLSKHNYMYTINGRKHLKNILNAFMTTHTHTQTNGNVSIFFHLNDILYFKDLLYIRKFYVYSKINVTIYPLDFNYQ